MKRYFCNYCIRKITADSDYPCERCIKLLNEALELKSGYSHLSFGRVKFLIDNQVMGEDNEPATREWFDVLLPSIRRYADLIKKPEEEKPQEPKEPIIDEPVGESTNQ